VAGGRYGDGGWRAASSDNRTRSPGSDVAFQGCLGNSAINGDGSHGLLATLVPTWRMSRSTEASNSDSGPLWDTGCEGLHRALVGARQAGDSSRYIGSLVVTEFAREGWEARQRLFARPHCIGAVSPARVAYQEVRYRSLTAMLMGCGERSP